MDTISRRGALRLLALGTLGLAACNARRLPDSRRQTWTVLVDLSGTAVTDRQYYAKELDLFIQGIAEIKPGAVVDRLRLIDIAPTVAHLLGLEMKEVEGRRVAEILK
jgi:hypothetical protein